MPSIYKKLKKSDRKFIRTEKSRIRREFLGFKKQEELISELYKKLLGEPKINKDDDVEKNKEIKKTKKDLKKEKTKKVKLVK